MRWWWQRSQSDRFDLYIRVTLYSNLLFIPLGLAGALMTGFGSAGRAALILACGSVQVVLCVLLMRDGIARYLDRRPLPGRLVAVAGVATAGTAVVAADALPAVVALYAGALATVVRPALVLLLVGVPGCLATWALDPPAAIALAGILLVAVPACRVTLWTLGLVRELERTRHVQAVLAVAEERLRFARDLHDVIGRTLSVVALKAELSARLAERGRAQAVTEMLEVRRIAQDSLVELRTVVGGYRAAGLSTELAGARALLGSAGITCRVDAAGEDLPAEVQNAFGWVVREGTTNVLRHSEARECVITVRTAAGTATLAMTDDGVAPAGGRLELGNGLVGLTERISALGGTVTASRDGGGFRLVATLAVGGPA